jgi:N-acetylmuramoyl-L-alanine amidase
MTSVADRPGSAPADDGKRVVIIDAGHGGEDPGSISRSGVQEKTVALGVALAIAHALESVPNLEVHLLRDDDTFIPLWERGAMATDLKGERPGVFISVHANSFKSSARGFEAYFLSDARTEHERRVAAIENAPVGHEEEGAHPGGDLDFILRELKNLDTQHWSALLAQMIQRDVAGIHPGPDRGVKQAPLAVITTALMPAVLVEVGYLSHPEEARLLATPAFQKKAGQAIARAVTEFFDRYPPGSGGVTGAGR